MRPRRWRWPVALLVVLAMSAPPATAHDDQHGEGWHGLSRAEELARAFLADSEPTQALSAASGSCTAGSAAGYPCSNVDLLAFLPLADIGGGKGNDVWGWTDGATGKQYALMGRSTGTSFVDISDPAHPVYLGNLPTTRFSSSWRDIKVYADHAFIVSEASNHGMQVFDLRRLRTVVNAPVTFSATALYKGISTAHNLVINEATGYAYVVGSNTCSGGLHIVDIRAPGSPSQAGCYSGDGYTHDAQCVVYSGPDGTHAGREICIASNEDTVTIVDVTDKAAPRLVSRTSYPGVEYAHQGWLTDDQRHFLLDDELDESRRGHDTRTYVWDMVDLDAPRLIGFSTGRTPAIDHNQYVKGRYSYQADYRAGLRILDLVDVASGVLTEVGHFDVYPQDDAAQFNGAWSAYPYFADGVVLISGIEQGLFVVRPDLTSNTAPSVSLVDPVDGARVAGTVPIQVSASDVQDPVGTLTVEWRLDSGAWEPAAYDTTTGRYVASWDSTGAVDGNHTIHVRARDADLASAADSNGVIVDNVPDTTTVHVHDLDAAKSIKGKSGKWEATVTVAVHSETPSAGATVSGTWSGARTGSVSGTTASDGTVAFATGSISGSVVTFTVTNVSLAGSPYSAQDHDPDGDSDGTTIVVTKE